VFEGLAKLPETAYLAVMRINMKTAETELAARLAGIPDAQDIAWAAVWLEACGYGGIKLLADALTDGARSHDLARDALGIDLQNISCAFLAPAIMRDVKANGRVFLRNVRHGLFMLPFTVRDNIGLGCPIDPSFAVGGERLKNPYAEKLALAEAEGLDIDETAWAQASGA
jgi:hypothetical protein